MESIGAKELLEKQGKPENYWLYQDEEVQELRTPKTIDSKVFWLFEAKKFLKKGPEYVAIIDDCYVNHRGGVYTKDKVFIKGSSLKAEDICLKDAVEINNDVGVISNIWANENYYHYLFNSIQRLDLIDKSPFKDKVEWVFTNMGKKPYFAQIAKSVNYDLRPSQNKVLKCKRVILPALIDAPSTNERICKYFNSMSESIEVEKGSRIYSFRGMRRVIRNESEVRKLLVDKYGFKLVSNASLTFDKQIELYGSAEMIVGVHGANLANIVFAKKGTKVLEMHNPSYVGLAYWSLANYSDLDYYYLMAEGKLSNSEEDYCPRGNCIKNVTIDVGKLEETLKLMGA